MFITTLGQDLARTLDLLREIIARHAVRHRALAPLILLAWNRLCRLRNRFDRLVLLWERDQFPTPRAPRPSRPARERRPPATSRLSSAKDWLGGLVPLARSTGGLFQTLFDDPDTRALVAAHPPAGRLLRPLARMIGLDLPDYLKLPPRPPRPRRPRPPSPAALRRAAEAALPPLRLNSEADWPHIPDRHSIERYLLRTAARRRKTHP